MNIPKAVTLKKYGLSEQEWEKLYYKYGARCHCCLRIPPSGKYYVDHEHLKDYKKFPIEVRRKAVRGLCCFHCNRRLLQRGNDNIKKLSNAIRYLKDYENKKQSRF